MWPLWQVGAPVCQPPSAAGPAALPSPRGNPRTRVPLEALLCGPPARAVPSALPDGRVLPAENWVPVLWWAIPRSRPSLENKGACPRLQGKGPWAVTPRPLSAVGSGEGSEGRERDRAKWLGPARGDGARVCARPGGGLGAVQPPGEAAGPLFSAQGCPDHRAASQQWGVRAVLGFHLKAGPVSPGVGIPGPQGSSLPAPGPGRCPAEFPVARLDVGFRLSGSASRQNSLSVSLEAPALRRTGGVLCSDEAPGPPVPLPGVRLQSLGHRGQRHRREARL